MHPCAQASHASMHSRMYRYCACFVYLCAPACLPFGLRYGEREPSLLVAYPRPYLSAANFISNVLISIPQSRVSLLSE